MIALKGCPVIGPILQREKLYRTDTKLLLIGSPTINHRQAEIASELLQQLLGDWDENLLNMLLIWSAH